MSHAPLLCLLLAACALAVRAEGQPPSLHGELIFTPQKLHNHGSCIVECPNGDLLVCWYRGSGERRADDVAIMGARRRKGSAQWSAPFLMADTPGFPDCNPCLIIDPQKRLWLFWVTVMDNHWESALLKYKISGDYTRDAGAPRWNTEKVLHVKPGPEFPQAVERDLDKQWEPYFKAASAEQKAKLEEYRTRLHRMAGETLSVRLGWMTRAHPFLLDEKRMIVPLYSDGFDFSLMAFTDDGGETWKASAPLVGPGNVQPSIARRRDGTLVAFFRDNGPPPQRVMISESRDDGLTWSLARDIALKNSGAGNEVCVLKSGRWIFLNNDTEDGRHRLAVHVSEDEGRTWPITRYLERDEALEGRGSYAYPSVMQARDGTIHVTYSYTPNRANAAREGAGESIKHVQFNEAWLSGKDEG